mmetsp:Transcript_3032/g.6907  ORF Transcript_3032/g.6907 Transcript_3032/m.6907 type:complete len:134 (+) Transcript_3032:214-615(+)
MVKPVLQTDFTASKGNALQACVASALELELGDVPNFIATDDPYKSLRGFLGTKGLGFMKVGLEEGVLPFAVCEEDTKSVCIIAGPSPRGSHKHCVVAEACGTGLRGIMDPHPDATMLGGPPVWAGFFVKLDPK